MRQIIQNRWVVAVTLIAIFGLVAADYWVWSGYLSVRETWYGVTPELVRNFFFGWRG